MKLFFDPETLKLIDITSSPPNELIYHYSAQLHDQEHPTCYDKYKEGCYQISPHQLDVGNVPKDIFFPEIYDKIFNCVPDKHDFILGFTRGQTDGYLHGQRLYFSKPRHTSWSYLIGYEYGILTGHYLNMHP